MPGDDEPDLDLLRRSLEGIPEVNFAYLFGSWARQGVHGESDVDLALHVKGQVLERRTELLEKLFAVLSRAIASHRLDLVFLNEAPVLLRHKVLEEGKLIQCHDRGLWAEFFVRTCDEFADWAPFIEPHVLGTRTRILEGRPFGQSGDFERSLTRARKLFRKT